MTDNVIRLMTSADLERVLDWRNHPEVRRYMYTNHVISFEEHKNWYASAELNPDLSLLIYEENGEPRGFVNFKVIHSGEVADWGFYIAPDAEKGTGTRLAESALNYAFDKLKLHKVCGQALDFNTRSIRFHRSLGFVEEGRLRDQHHDGSDYHDVVCFGLLSHEWFQRAGV